jgi:cardiolipin synthase
MRRIVQRFLDSRLPPSPGQLPAGDAAPPAEPGHDEGAIAPAAPEVIEPRAPEPRPATRDPAFIRYGAEAIRWTVFTIILVSAAIGLLFITRGTAVRHVRGIGADTTVVAPAEPGFPLLVSLLTGTSLVSGNRVELALDGDGTFPRLWADLRAARQSITLQMYYAQSGLVADSLGAILEERARAGVAVAVLFDAFGAQDLGGAFADRLRAAGARVVSFRPLRFENLWVVQNRSHVRGIVIDGQVGWTGGFGIDDKWLGDGRAGTGWRETNVRFEGPAALQLRGAFAAGWAEATGELFTGHLTLEPRDDGVAAAGLLFTAPTLGSTPAERYLALSIASARQRLYITNAYFAPDTNFVALLTRAARRGVDVRLLVGGPRTDVRAARLAAHARYETLMDAGIHIYEYQPTTLHAKTFVVDGVWSSIGTMNFDNRSLALNDESTLMVLDSTFGRQMEAMFREDLRYARAIDPVAFGRRPWYRHVAEWAADQITRLL